MSSWSALLGTRASNSHWDLNPDPLPASQAHVLDHLTTLFSCICSHTVSWGFSWYKHVIQDHVMLSTFSYQIGLFWRAETLGHFCPQRGHWMLEMRHFLLSLVLNVLEKLMLPKESSISFVKKTIYRLINISWLTSEALALCLRTLQEWEVCFLLKIYPAVLSFLQVWSWGTVLFDEWINSSQVLVSREQKFQKVSSQRRYLDAILVSLGNVSQ